MDQDQTVKSVGSDLGSELPAHLVERMYDIASLSVYHRFCIAVERVS